jgi:nitrogen regulatory protein PII
VAVEPLTAATPSLIVVADDYGYAHAYDEGISDFWSSWRAKNGCGGFGARLSLDPSRRMTLGSRASRGRNVDQEGRSTVKLVIGIVRPEKANDVLEALYRAEVRGLSMSPVQGHGGELDRVETYRGTTVKVGLADKVRFEIAVSDDFVQPTIDALCDGGRTGEVGDGKIFVVPLERAVRIRTGETDHGAVTPVAA